MVACLSIVDVLSPWQAGTDVFNGLIFFLEEDEEEAGTPLVLSLPRIKLYEPG